MLTVLLLVAIAAFALTIASAMGRLSLWIPVLLLCIWTLLYSLPLGKG